MPSGRIAGSRVVLSLVSVVEEGAVVAVGACAMKSALIALDYHHSGISIRADAAASD